jgi:hypothetical protein
MELTVVLRLRLDERPKLWKIGDMKKNNRFRNYLRIEVCVILLVLLCFRMIPDKRTASLITSMLFILSSFGILIWEIRYPQFQKRATFWGLLVFLLFSALPILLVRLAYWDLPFEEIQVLGVSGTLMHRASSYVFFLLLICLFVDSYQEAHKERISAK